MTTSIKEALEKAQRFIASVSDSSPQVQRRRDEAWTMIDQALATFQPDGERREAIARITFEHEWERPWSDAQPYERDHHLSGADKLLASGLVQDEAGWRDISTAPKNHFPILTWSEQGGRCVAFLDVTWTWWPCPATEPLSNKPTHWKPLPAPPIRSARDGGAET